MIQPKSEKELQIINERLSFHLENTTLGLIEWDNKLHVKSWSKRAEEIFGWTEKEFIEKQKTGYNQVYIDDQPRVFKIAEQLIAGDIKRNKVKHRNYTKDGKVIWCEWFNSVLKDKDGKVITVVSLVQDITAYKELEEKLNRANHLYSFISQINQNIVRVKDEETLFRNACRIALDYGKFKMAWIGVCNSTCEVIKLAEQSGMSKEDVSLFFNAPEQINSLQEIVLSTGNIYICNDIANDFPFENRKSFMAERDYLSCMIIPVKKSGTIMGTFNLFSPDLNYFNKEEVALLLEMTADISFALDLFEKAKKQKKTEALVVHNENRFRLLIEKSSDMKTLSNREGRIIYSSPSIERVLGYTAEEYLSKYPNDIIHPDDIARYLKDRNELLQTPGKSRSFEQRRRHKNGDWIWCEGAVTNLLEEPDINALVSNFRDASEKKRRENEKEFDKNNLSALINNTKDLMWSVDKNFNLITSNELFDEMSRVNFGKILTKGDNILSVSYTPEMMNHFKALYERAFKGESFIEIDHFDFPVEMWSEISYYPIFKGDEVIGTACYSRDITERKRAEEKLRRSEAYLVEAQRLAKMGSWNYDVTTDKLTWSEELFHVFGADKQTFHETYNSFKNLIDAGDREYASQVSKRTQQTGEPFLIDYHITTPKGEKRIIQEHGYGEKDVHGIVTRMFGTAQDISERKFAEENLRESEARLKEAQAISKVGNWEVDLLTLNLKWSEETFKIFELNPDDFGLTYKAFMQFVYPDDRAKVEMAFKGSFNAEGITAIEHRIITAKGNIRIIEDRWKVWRDEQGLPNRVLGTTHDITERRKAEQHLEGKNKELLKTNSELDRFVYSTSHDLRAPLASLLGLIAIVNHNTDPANSVQLEQVKMMKQSVLKLDNFIEDILNYSRNSRTELAKDDIVFEDMISEARAEHKYMEGTAGFKLQIEIKQTEKFISDKRRISIVLNNLISNAVKYKDSNKEKSFVHIHIKADKKNATIVIEDNGIGIAEKDKEKIFEMFYRASKQSTGSGLGLYIVKETIDKLRATITVESQKSMGSKFTVIIPNCI